MKKRLFDIAIAVLNVAMFVLLIISKSGYISGAIMILISLCWWLSWKSAETGEKPVDKKEEPPLVGRKQIAIAFSVFTVVCWVFILLPFFV